MHMNIFKNIIVSLVYAIVYQYAYLNYSVANFSYLYKVDYHEMSIGVYLCYILLSVAPFVFYKGLKTIASGISLFVYILVYVPFICNLLTNGYSSGDVVIFTAVFFISMCLFFATDKMVILKEFAQKKRKKLKLRTFEIITVLVFIFLIIENRNNFRFVNFFVDSDVMYDLRAAYAGGRSALNVYLMYWTKSVFLPLLLVAYINNRNYFRYALTFIGYIIMFMFDMQKVTFFMPFVITLACFFCKRRGKNIENTFHTYLILFIAIVSFLTTYYSNIPSIWSIAFIFVLRTQCIEGLELGLYMDFFETTGHPYTYYSHINIVNALTGMYPYKDSIGRAVMDYESNANGCFWLMDGIAAAGILGCIIISIVFIYFKAAMNSVGIGKQPVMCVIVLFSAISLMVNVSLFTALFSCGFIVFYLIMLYFDIDCLDANNYNLKQIK